MPKLPVQELEDSGYRFFYTTPTPQLTGPPFVSSPEPIDDEEEWEAICSKISAAIAAGAIDKLTLSKEEQDIIARNPNKIPEECKQQIRDLWNADNYLADASQFFLAYFLWVNNCITPPILTVPTKEGEDTPILNFGELTEGFVNAILLDSLDNTTTSPSLTSTCDTLKVEANEKQREFLNNPKYKDPATRGTITIDDPDNPGKKKQVPLPDPQKFVDIVKGMASGLRNENPGLNTDTENGSLSLGQRIKGGLFANWQKRGYEYYQKQDPEFKLPMDVIEFGEFVEKTKDETFIGIGAGAIPGGLLGQWGTYPNVDDPAPGATANTPSITPITNDDLAAVADVFRLIAGQVTDFIDNLSEIKTGS